MVFENPTLNEIFEKYVDDVDRADEIARIDQSNALAELVSISPRVHRFIRWGIGSALCELADADKAAVRLLSELLKSQQSDSELQHRIRKDLSDVAWARFCEQEESVSGS